MDLIQITSGFTSIAVMPNEVRHTGISPRSGGSPFQATHRGSMATGARVTLEFARPEPLLSSREVRVRYDIAENGTYREFTGTPQLTHTTVSRSPAFLYHYRISHWIGAPHVMDFRANPAPVRMYAGSGAESLGYS